MSKAHNIIVTVSRFQSVRVAGMALESVVVDSGILIIRRKKPRAGRFETFVYPLDQVDAYHEGEGGKDGLAYAIVPEEAILITIAGKGIVDAEGWVRVTDKDQRTHSFNSKAAGLHVVISKAEDDKVDTAPARRSAK